MKRPASIMSACTPSRRLNHWQLYKGKIIWRLIALFALVGSLGLAACNSQESSAPTPATPTIAGPTRLPTPTLAVVLPDDAAMTTTPSPTPEPPTPTPTATPPPELRWEMAQTAFDEGDYDTVIAQLAAYTSAAPETAPLAVWQLLSRAYSQDARWPEAVQGWLRVLTLAPDAADTFFFLAQAYQAQGNCERALPNYRDFVQANPDLAAYVQPRSAACLLAMGEKATAKEAYLAAEATEAHFLTIYYNRVALADLYLADAEYQAAADVYRRIRDAAQTYFTRGEMTYRAGNALILAGQTEAGYAEYQRAVHDFPDLNTSYQALVSLVEAGVPVDDYDRGLVDYYAQAYSPAVEAFNRYLVANPPSLKADARLYLGRSYAGLGQVEAALTQFEQYAALSAGNAPAGLLASADLLAQQGQTDEALALYGRAVGEYPGHARAPEAALSRARLAASVGREAEAIDFYTQAADKFPTADSAPEALFSAGRLAWQERLTTQAISLWQRAADSYPTARYGQAAHLWLVRVQPETLSNLELPPVRSSYFSLRLHDLQDGVAPFQAPRAINLGNGRVTDQAGAEAWLRARLNVPESADIRPLAAPIAADARYQRGQRLWQLGLTSEARRELEAVRESNAGDALSSYQLALALRDMGLYRSSIAAAVTLLNLTRTDALDAPPFLAALAYPTYYADLILPLAAEYGYDPLLQFALVRQESMFESFATSSAVAQGLAQVIPDTGAYIAGRLGWSDFENADLYRPYVGLRFGAYYLYEQLNTFDGYIPAALAAYNGGPGNAARWYRVAGSDIDAFIEAITFDETRLYVERIYTGHSLYRYLYGE